jgi:hypothetical protein
VRETATSIAGIATLGGSLGWLAKVTKAGHRQQHHLERRQVVDVDEDGARAHHDGRLAVGLPRRHGAREGEVAARVCPLEGRPTTRRTKPYLSQNGYGI